MELPSLKDLVKGNTVHLFRYKSGNLFYQIKHSDDDELGSHTIYEFPVPISDTGEAEFKYEDKAIYFMRYIKKAMAEGTFIFVAHARY